MFKMILNQWVSRFLVLSFILCSQHVALAVRLSEMPPGRVLEPSERGNFAEKPKQLGKRARSELKDDDAIIGEILAGSLGALDPGEAEGPLTQSDIAKIDSVVDDILGHPIALDLPDLSVLSRPLPAATPPKEEEKRSLYESVPEGLRALGPIYQVRGLIWGSIPKDADSCRGRIFSYKEAVNFCAGLGAEVRLPTRAEFYQLLNAMGAQDPERFDTKGYKSDLISENSNAWLWSKSIHPVHHDFAYALRGDLGWVRLHDRRNKGAGFSVRCVIPVASLR